MGLRKSSKPEADFLPGTLEMLILKTLSRGPNHGFELRRARLQAQRLAKAVSA